MMWQCCDSREEKRSESVCLIFDELNSVFWNIRDLKDEETQERITLSLFQKLGKFTDILKLAEAILDAKKFIKMSSLKKEEKEDKEEMTLAKERAWYLEDMLESLDSTTHQGVGAGSSDSSDFVTV